MRAAFLILTLALVAPLTSCAGAIPALAKVVSAADLALETLEDIEAHIAPLLPFLQKHDPGKAELVKASIGVARNKAERLRACGATPTTEGCEPLRHDLLEALQVVMSATHPLGVRARAPGLPGEPDPLLGKSDDGTLTVPTPEEIVGVSGAEGGGPSSAPAGAP